MSVPRNIQNFSYHTWNTSALPKSNYMPLIMIEWRLSFLKTMKAKQIKFTMSAIALINVEDGAFRKISQTTTHSMQH